MFKRWYSNARDLYASSRIGELAVLVHLANRVTEVLHRSWRSAEVEILMDDMVSAMGNGVKEGSCLKSAHALGCV